MINMLYITSKHQFKISCTQCPARHCLTANYEAKTLAVCLVSYCSNFKLVSVPENLDHSTKSVVLGGRIEASKNPGTQWVSNSGPLEPRFNGLPLEVEPTRYDDIG